MSFSRLIMKAIKRFHGILSLICIKTHKTEREAKKISLAVIQKTDGIHTGASAQQSKFSSLITMYTIHLSPLTMYHLCWLVDTSDDSRASSIYVSRLCCTLHTSWLDTDSSLTFPLFFLLL